MKANVRSPGGLVSWKSEREQRRVRELIGVESLTDCGYRRKEGGETVVFLLEPDNLTVLSQAGAARKVYGLMTVLKGYTELEFCCVNARENYTGNKRYLRERLREEKNERVRALLRSDLEELERMETGRSGARAFLVLLRLKDETVREAASLLNRVEKAFQEQGIKVRRITRDELKRIFAVYFGRKSSAERLEDFDGERWVTEQDA